MDHTKIYTEDLNSPRREFSNGGLGIVVALTLFQELIFSYVSIGRAIQL